MIQGRTTTMQRFATKLGYQRNVTSVELHVYQVIEYGRVQVGLKEVKAYLVIVSW